MSTSRTVRGFAVAVSLLPLLAACGSDTASSPAGAGKVSAGSTGSTGQLAIPADANADLKQQYLLENAIAACMKKQGLTYTPVAPEDPMTGYATTGADYAQTKKFREKYGFGNYAGIVYPNDPKAPGSKADTANSTPNADYVATLTPANKAAYDKALGGPPEGRKGAGSGCVGDAYTETGWNGADEKKKEAARAEEDQAAGQALNGDPKLVSLAQSYASCLKKDGIDVTTTLPTSIGDAVRLQGGATQGAAAPAESGTKPMDKDTALPLLTKEIQVAMQDLACGKDFRAAYFPKFMKHPYSGGGAG